MVRGNRYDQGAQTHDKMPNGTWGIDAENRYAEMDTTKQMGSQN